MWMTWLAKVKTMDRKGRSTMLGRCRMRMVGRQKSMGRKVKNSKMKKRLISSLALEGSPLQASIRSGVGLISCDPLFHWIFHIPMLTCEIFRADLNCYRWDLKPESWDLLSSFHLLPLRGRMQWAITSRIDFMLTFSVLFFTSTASMFWDPEQLLRCRFLIMGLLTSLRGFSLIKFSGCLIVDRYSEWAIFMSSWAFLLAIMDGEWRTVSGAFFFSHGLCSKSSTDMRWIGSTWSKPRTTSFAVGEINSQSSSGNS